MSHITKAKSKIKNLTLLKQALKDLGMNFEEATEENQLSVKAWNKEKETENIIMSIDTGCSYNAGVVYNTEEETYEFVADWWGIETYTEVTQEDFINKITQKYAYNNIMEKVKEKGYQLVNEEVDDKNQIRVVVRKWQ